jgi:hypothetical protein
MPSPQFVTTTRINSRSRLVFPALKFVGLAVMPLLANQQRMEFNLTEAVSSSTMSRRNPLACRWLTLSLSAIQAQNERSLLSAFRWQKPRRHSEESYE